MGFLDGLTTLLGGFSDVKQIDEEGFDFREKRAAEQFKRDQDREDWATKAAAEASLGTEDEAALASTIPGDVNRHRVMARALGAGKQAKSALQAQKAYTDAALLAQRGDQTAREIGLRGDEAESLARVRADLEAGRQPSERDRFIADQAAKRTGMTIEGMLQRARMGGGRGGGKPQLRLTTDGYKWFYPPSDPGGSGDAGADGGGGASGVVSTGEQGPLGVTAKESNVVGTGALASIAALENLMKSTPGSENWFGPGAAIKYRTRAGQSQLPGPIGKVGQVLGEALTEPPTSEQALAYSVVGGLKNQGIRAITGAQMSEREVPRILQEIPTEEDRGPVFWAKMAVTKARFELLDAVRTGRISREEAIDQINSIGPEHFLRQYQEQGLTGGGDNLLRITNEQEYNALPAGSSYIGPDGKRRKKGAR